ncbi:MAG TPA: hypothetical protein VM555_00960 [Tahibacter sp.]|nr:hypothetical protein [Tahibacter sp.]
MIKKITGIRSRIWRRATDAAAFRDRTEDDAMNAIFFLAALTGAVASPGASSRQTLPADVRLVKDLDIDYNPKHSRSVGNVLLRRDGRRQQSVPDRRQRSVRHAGYVDAGRRLVRPLSRHTCPDAPGALPR